MAKAITYVLILLCVFVVLWGVSDKSGEPDSETVLEGESLRLLYDLTDSELGDLALPEGAGEFIEDDGVSAPESDFPAEDIAADPELEPILALLPEVSLEEAVENAAVIEAGTISRSISGPAEPVCLSIGELRNTGDAARLEARIRERGVDVVRVTRITEELGPYMVYIQPQSNADAALEIVESLRADRVESLIIRDGPYENGVSLGVFRSDENSAALASRIRGLGYDARRRRMSVEVELYSFLLQADGAGEIKESFWREIRSEFDGVDVVQKSCEEVASASNFQ